MKLKPEHEMHKRRQSRNIGLGLVLVLFVAIVFGLSMVKVTRGGLGPQPATTLPPAEASDAN